MPRTLDVYLRRHLVGQLIQDENGQIGISLCRELVEQRRRNSAFPFACRSEKKVLTATSAGDFLPGSCRMKVNARSSQKISESAPETISPCWNKSAANAPER